MLLNVFPFRDARDVEECERRFGWLLPASLRRLAEGGEATMLDEEREVARLVLDGAFAGIYLNTRGSPSTAEFILS